MDSLVSSPTEGLTGTLVRQSNHHEMSTNQEQSGVQLDCSNLPSAWAMEQVKPIAGHPILQRLRS